jgi:hypothetical protein
MPSASSFTNKVRANTEARNTKVEYPGNVLNQNNLNPLLCTNYITDVSIIHNTTNNIYTFAGTPTVFGYSGDGQSATSATLYYPYGVTVSPSRNIYIADQYNNVIRKVDKTTGIITTFAGTGVAGYNGDNIPATSAQLTQPTSVTFDSNENMYIADRNNYIIRKVDKTTGIITTFAGTGVAGYNGDNIPATSAQLNDPTSVTFDSNENMYISDTSNSIVRKVDKTTGIITTFAGTGVAGYNGDNIPATSAQLNFPTSVTFDSNENMYISDTNNNIVRKVDKTTGIITTFAGTPQRSGYAGDGGPATSALLYVIYSVSIDSVKNIYIVDWYSNVIRKVDTLGIISTFAGNGLPGYYGDGGNVALSQLNRPTNTAIDSNGYIYIVDQHNYIIRRVLLDNSVDVVKKEFQPPWWVVTNYKPNCKECVYKAITPNNPTLIVNDVGLTFGSNLDGVTITLSVTPNRFDLPGLSNINIYDGLNRIIKTLTADINYPIDTFNVEVDFTTYYYAIVTPIYTPNTPGRSTTVTCDITYVSGCILSNSLYSIQASWVLTYPSDVTVQFYSNKPSQNTLIETQTIVTGTTHTNSSSNIYSGASYYAIITPLRQSFQPYTTSNLIYLLDNVSITTSPFMIFNSNTNSGNTNTVYVIFSTNQNTTYSVEFYDSSNNKIGSAITGITVANSTNNISCPSNIVILDIIVHAVVTLSDRFTYTTSNTVTCRKKK